MRLALVGPIFPYRGGIAHYTTLLHRALTEQGHDVLLVSFKRQYPRWLFPGQSDRDQSKEPIIVREAHYWIDSLNPLSWLLTFWRIFRFRPRTIVLQWWTSFWTPVWLTLAGLNRLFARSRLVMICHNVLPHEVHWWDALVARTVFRLADSFIVQSPSEAQRLAGLITGARISVVPHPVYDMFAHQRLDRSEARRRLGLSAAAPVMLCFGVVRPYKGLHDLIEAMPRVLERRRDTILLVAGEIWGDKQAYREAIRRLDLGSAVILEDRYIPNEEVPAYFGAADVLIAPYRRVTGSGSIQMAVGFQLPVITTADCLERGPAEDGMPIDGVRVVDRAELADEIIRFFAETRAESAADGLRGSSADGWDVLASQVVNMGAGS